MKSVRILWLLPIIALIGCADGGPVGTGISGASISGNVIEVSNSTSVSGVEVSVDEVPGVATTTDDQGDFQLTGDFSGNLTLRFQPPQQSAATLSIEMPAGGELGLNDIQIRSGMAQVGNIELRKFFGVVAFVDCTPDSTGGAEIGVDDHRAMMGPHQFLVRVSAEAVILDREGNALTCADIKPRAQISVAGRVRNDMTIQAFSLVLNPPAPGQPQPVDQRKFGGTVAVVNCHSGLLLIFDDEIGEARLNLKNTSLIKDAALQPLSCSAIGVGDRVDGRGVIVARRPGVFDVIEVTVTPAT
jgi:hypothetical protein